MCGELNASRYGRRGAARDWEAKYVEVLSRLGFVVGASPPRPFWGERRDLWSAIHGDNIAFVGDCGGATWFEQASGGKLEVKLRAPWC